LGLARNWKLFVDVAADNALIDHAVTAVIALIDRIEALILLA
jgi:hypothetical protein